MPLQKVEQRCIECVAAIPMDCSTKLGCKCKANASNSYLAKVTMGICAIVMTYRVFHWIKAKISRRALDPALMQYPVAQGKEGLMHQSSQRARDGLALQGGPHVCHHMAHGVHGLVSVWGREVPRCAGLGAHT